jgi:hypothetical protein
MKVFEKYEIFEVLEMLWLKPKRPRSRMFVKSRKLVMAVAAMDERDRIGLCVHPDRCSSLGPFSKQLGH